jgi:SAM-dependent methyltransferase
MKKYFEYKFDLEIEKKLVDYYENVKLNQHDINHFFKADLKLKRILSLSPFTKQDNVLDVGCSRGYLLKIIAPIINTGRGIDISKNIIRSNVEDNKNSNISFEVFNGSIFNSTEKYNKVLLIDVLEHAFSPDELINTVKNIMVQDGLLIAEVPFTGFLSEFIFGKYHQGHLRYYDQKYLSEYFEKFNFEIIKIKVFNSVPFASRFIKLPILFKMLDFLVNLIPPKIYPYFGEILIITKNGK